jgi:hypothetical protein
MAVNPATVTVDVHDGEVTITGQLDMRSQLSLVEDMTRHIDGVVDVTVSMTYRHDDTRDHLPEGMTIDITQPPRVRPGDPWGGEPVGQRGAGSAGVLVGAAAG